jgi:hypothetical protein
MPVDANPAGPDEQSACLPAGRVDLHLLSLEAVLRLLNLRAGAGPGLGSIRKQKE